MKRKILQDLFVGTVIAFISVALGYWVEIRSEMPVIEIDYSQAYAHVDSTRIGYVFVGNSGKTTDTNISITIDALIQKENISIPELTSDLKVSYDGGETTITITALRPSEKIRLFFTPNSSDGYDFFDITRMVSDSNNFYPLEYVGWWNISFETRVVFAFMLLVSLFIGFYVTKRVVQTPQKKWQIYRTIKHLWFH